MKYLVQVASTRVYMTDVIVEVSEHSSDPREDAADLAYEAACNDESLEWEYHDGMGVDVINIKRIREEQV